jgi:molybdopterin molybdotransferase
VLSLEEARERILAAIPPLTEEPVPVAAAWGRFAARDVVSPLDLPAFDNSAMDGYAVRAEDVAAASASSPVALRLAGQTAAGETFAGTLHPGECVRVFTGSALPAGADAVVMQEDTRLEPAKPGQVLILDRARPWENVRLRGEDVKRGATICEAGARVSAGVVGLLAATGIASVAMRRRPVIGLLATGSELLEAGAPWTPGKIYESHRVSLAPLLDRAGAVPRVFPLVPDTLDDTRRALEEAFSACDAVVTTGGVSVGELDWVKAAFESLGGELGFWKVAIRPGKPFVFGRWQEKFLFGLPGNPVSAVVTFLLLVRPALLRWQGAGSVALPAQNAVLAEPLVNRGDRRHFMRVRRDETGAVRLAGIQASHALSSLALADGLVDVPPATTLPAGASVSVLSIEG